MNTLLSMLGLLAGEGVIVEKKPYKYKGEKMPLNMIETHKLKSLRGKAKKRYLKELRAKYYGDK